MMFYDIRCKHQASFARRRNWTITASPTSFTKTIKSGFVGDFNPEKGFSEKRLKAAGKFELNK
jgi:hypothetical protein